MSDLCIKCNLVVTSRQEALLCDGCSKWNHRTCGTGVTRDTYCTWKKMKEFEWRYSECSPDITNLQPIFESSRQSIDLFFGGQLTFFLVVS